MLGGELAQAPRTSGAVLLERVPSEENERVLRLGVPQNRLLLI